MTEGYLWTGQYPDCQRVIDEGNNQSMELDPKTIKGTWTKGKNGSPDFFIINEAIFSKLCILGEENEPCFEGASITDVQFSFNDDFKNELRSMMNELKQLLQKGGEKEVFKRYAVQIGDALWNALYSFVDDEKYTIDGVYEDETTGTFAVVKDSDNKYYRVNFSLSESNEFSANEEFEDITDSYVVSEEPQFSIEDILNYKKKKEEEEGSEDKEDEDNSDDSSNKEEDEADDEEDEDDDEKKKNKNKTKYSLEEIPEYTELMAKYSDLETKYNTILEAKETLESQVNELTNFKNKVERKDKEELIASFYMLTDEDKEDVIKNIDTYSLDQIEAKLAIICVRNKVNFDSEEDQSHKDKKFTFSLEDDDIEDTSTPAWVKAALAVEKRMK